MFDKNNLFIKRLFTSIVTLLIILFIASCTAKSDIVDFKIISFGIQDGAPISWYVIGEDEKHLLLMSEKVLDTMPFHNENIKVDWINSSLFDYLNSDFINEYFTKSEQEKIAFINESDDTKVTMPSLNNLIDLYGDISYMPDEYYGVDGYFEANKNIVAKPSERALNNDIDIFDNSTFAEIMGEDIDHRYDFANGNVSYWVINTSDDTNDVFLVAATGYINYLEPNTEYIGIRPIIRVKK